MLILAFKVLIGLNALGVALILAVAFELLQLSLSPLWFRLPLAMFLAGMVLALLGLFWTGILRTALWRQYLSHGERRGFWLPALFAMLSHFLALIMFAAACWALLGVTALSHYYDDAHPSPPATVPYFQHR